MRPTDIQPTNLPSNPLLRFVVISLFPDSLNMLTTCGITGRAHETQLWQLQALNPRDFTDNKHRRVDDRPYGGGAGMVMQAPPLKAAILAAKAMLGADTQVIYMSPQGVCLNQALTSSLVTGVFEPKTTTNMIESDPKTVSYIILCGRYEGVDERLLDHYVDLEISIGDYVVSGGEIPAMVLIDAMVRLLPGACGHEDSPAQDSFSHSLLDYAQYTRPEVFEAVSVPQVLLSGDHQAIQAWRKANALARTKARRADLLDE